MNRIQTVSLVVIALCLVVSAARAWIPDARAATPRISCESTTVELDVGRKYAERNLADHRADMEGRLARLLSGDGSRVTYVNNFPIISGLNGQVVAENVVVCVAM